MSTINILCVVDAESLVKLYKDDAAKSRKILTHEQLHPYARMITKEANVLVRGDRDASSDQEKGLSTQASDDLSIKVKHGDILKWRAVSLTDDQEYKVEIIGFESVSVGSQPVELCNTDTWQTEITANSGTGRDAYWVNFDVIDTSGTTTCQFQWDPYITVVA